MSLDRALHEANETLRALLDADAPEALQPLVDRAHSVISDLITEVEEWRADHSEPDEEEAEYALRAAIRYGDVPAELRRSGDYVICDGVHVGRLLDGSPSFVRFRFERLIDRLGNLLEGT